MELILWRHAEAEVAEPDDDRALTPKGHKQAARMAEWLDRTLPNGCRVLASPARRTVQTAEALGRKFRVHSDLAVGASPQQVLAAVNWPDAREPVLVVGHQPTLGQVASFLIGGVAEDWTIRKASAWWIVQREGDPDGSIYIRAVMSPDLVQK